MWIYILVVRPSVCHDLAVSMVIINTSINIDFTKLLLYFYMYIVLLILNVLNYLLCHVRLEYFIRTTYMYTKSSAV